MKDGNLNFDATTNQDTSFLDQLHLKMEEKGPEVTFMFQFGLIRDAVTVPQSMLNLKTIKILAVDFLNSKVSLFFIIL